MKTVPKPSDPPTASRATYTSVTFIVFIAALLTILLAACSSTTIDEQLPLTAADEEDIMITLSTPNAYTFPSSRAGETDIHAGHVLRYTAILYKSLKGITGGVGINTAKGEENLVKRIELLDKDNVDKQIVFKGIEPGDYFIVVFADYIDENAEVSNETGHYTDKYYDTMTPAYITLKAQDDPKAYFNNDNLDFFIDHTDKFTKEKNQPKTFDITLHRHVSKVQVKATGGNIEALKEIVITGCYTLPQLEMISGSATAVEQKNISGNSLTLTPVNDALLYSYYTFCTGSKDNALKGTSFTLTPNDGYEFANNEGFSITAAHKIVPLANTIYTIQGAFLNTSTVPSNVADIKVTTNTNWETSSQDVSE